MPYPNCLQTWRTKRMVFNRTHCANSLCGPSRACIYTGPPTHMNGYLFNERGSFDGSAHFRKCSQGRLQTAVVGKWRLEAIPPGAKEIRPNMNPAHRIRLLEIFPGVGGNIFSGFYPPGKDGKRVVKAGPELCHGTGVTRKKASNENGPRGTRTNPSCSS